MAERSMAADCKSALVMSSKVQILPRPHFLSYYLFFIQFFILKQYFVCVFFKKNFARHFHICENETGKKVVLFFMSIPT